MVDIYELQRQPSRLVDSEIQTDAFRNFTDRKSIRL